MLEEVPRGTPPRGSPSKGAASISRLSKVGVAARMELLRVCGRARDPHATIIALRKLGEQAPPEAYVTVLVTIATDEAPNSMQAPPRRARP